MPFPPPSAGWNVLCGSAIISKAKSTQRGTAKRLGKESAGEKKTDKMKSEGKGNNKK